MRAEGLTVLDEAAGRASTVGWIGFYTPLAPRDGLHFSPDTELTPQVAVPPYRDRAQLNKADYRREVFDPVTAILYLSHAGHSRQTFSPLPDRLG